MKVTIKTQGPIFDEARREGLLEAGIAAGMKELVARVEATTKSKVLGSGIPSGPFVRSIKGEVKKPANVGVIRSDDTRPIRTWLERGTRRGVKLRKQSGGFAAGKNQARTLNKQGFFEDEIAKRLNG